VREAGKAPAPARWGRRPAAAWSPAVLRYAAAALILAAAAGLAVMIGPWRGAGNDEGSVGFTIAKLEEAQRYYEKAIRSLGEAIAAQKDRMNPELAEAFQRNLEAMDATIQACRTFVAKDPENPAVRAYLLSAYREKVSFLEEMMGAERASASAKTETSI
jgi:tetratricopeptide (TPR) repeat protein